ncbi:cationic amino acid transporter 9, chloroplastic-like [Lolium rigidum]|uniref:cationic amino acid transporter 9, chloroplastic-like n=1 Tax=Lolium rigidum TaxID=89674 RepID=UPI001F5E1B13|nr:cationic amino acid transporter 9, chloroplastic-like [Lolium rigidum]
MTQERTSLLPVWARTTARRPRTRHHHPLHVNAADAMEGEEDAHHRPSSSSSRPFLSGLCAAALRRKPLASRTAAAASSDGLVRQLGVLELVLIGIGASIGAGIFVITGTVARDAGPGVTISFALAGAACVLNALCYAELASRFPAVVGGAYLYTYAAFNELTAFLVFTQLMIDYHIGAASIARSLASYFIQFLELIPAVKGNVPSWIGHGEEFFGGVVSVNLLAPILLVILTVILCRGVKESSTVNTFMTTLKIVIVIVVVFAGVFEVDVSNWSPFMPNGFKAVVTGSTVVFFAYVGFDAVANSAEEAKRPQRDLPIGILGSLLVCVILYIAVCLVITGMVPYTLLGEDAPLAEAFAAKGLKFVTVLISIGAVAGLTTTLLVGLYVQSRLYLGLGRDGLLPSIFAKVHPTLHTPLHSQIWVGCVAAVLAGLFNVQALSHILSVGTLTGYSVVSACVITLRWSDKATNSRSLGSISIWQEGVLCLVTVALCGFVAGISYRFSYAIAFIIVAFLIAIVASFALQFRQVYVPVDAPRFSCPGVPLVPVLSVFFNMFLFAQLHVEAWYRFVILSLIAVGVYAGYGQYYSAPSTSDRSSVAYHGVPSEAP